MRTVVMKQMANLAKTATGPIGIIAKAALVQSPVGDYVDPAKLRDALKDAGLSVVSTTGPERYRAHLSAKRAGMKKTIGALVHDIELAGKTGIWTEIHLADAGQDGHTQVARGRSDTEDDALLHAMLGALREGR